ncbi:MAG: hypothetical protein HY855_19735, partial [Burkholderiales bacterium]|nr:hypothetical protein [Burkholderiales bacterium]
ATSAAAPPGPARPLAGAPDAGPRLGHDIATPPALPPSAPRLNLDLVPSRGAPIAGQATRGVLQLLPQPPDRKTKLAEEIEKAGKRDCRTAYSAMGLAALVPLAIDAARDKGCKW